MVVETMPLEYWGTFGFAALVTGYLLFERTKFNEKITENMTKQTVILEQICDKLKGR